MNFSRRRGTIAFFITLGVVLTGVAITLNIGWILLNERRLALLILGIFFFGALIAGVVLNTVFLVREIRRNERQDSFLNAVSHELKTPIASIRLYLETLQRRPIDEAQRQEFYRIMHADSDRLLATVEQVLKAGELGQRQRQQNRVLFELAPLITEAIALTVQRHHLPADAIVFEPSAASIELPVFGIPEDIRTALRNVLDNAVKYSPDGVHVRCALSVAGGTTVQVTIADQGIGLPPHLVKSIFKRFYRVPGRNMVRIKGTGLGLFLVRTILRQHGGDAKATSAGPGLGTTVLLSLPLARKPRPDLERDNAGTREADRNTGEGAAIARGSR